MRLTDIFKFKLFEGTDKADLEVVNENFEAVEDAMQAHAAGGDHDGRYLKKAEVVNNNTTTAGGYALDARQANPAVAGSLGEQIHSLNNSLTNHKSSGDHDGRYLKKAEVVNNNTTTAGGYALDARQANPAVAGSLGAQIHSLNSSLLNKISHYGINLHNETYEFTISGNTDVLMFKAMIPKGFFGSVMFYLNNQLSADSIINFKINGWKQMYKYIRRYDADTFVMPFSNLYGTDHEFEFIINCNSGIGKIKHSSIDIMGIIIN